MNLKTNYIVPFLIFLSIPFCIPAQNTGVNSVSKKGEEVEKLEVQIQNLYAQIQDYQKDQGIDTLIAEDTVFVKLFGENLWPVYISFGPLTPQERVDLTESKWDKIPFYKISSFFDSLQIIEKNGDVKVVRDSIILFYVSSDDARLEGLTSNQLAEKRIELIQSKTPLRHILNNKKELLWRLFKALVVVLILYLIIRLLNVGYRKLNLAIATKRGKEISGFKWNNYEIVNENQVLRIIFFVTKVIRLIVVLLLIFLSLPIIFGLFPWSQIFAETLLDYIFKPLHLFFWGFIDFIPNLISIILISYIGHLVLKLIKYISSEIENENLKISGFYPDWAKPTSKLLQLALYVLLVIFIFPFLPGSDSPIFKGVSVFIGIIFTLGSSSVVANIFSGLILTYMRPFKTGDRIKIDEIVGFVTEKTLLVTRLRTSKQEIITIPNSKILNTNIINFSTSIQQNDGIIIHTKITIGYDVPWRKIHKALLTAADQINTISKEPKPFVLQTALNDFYVEYEINAYIKDVKTLIGTQSKLNENIQDVFRDEGIEIMSPHYRSIRDGAESTIPKKENEDDSFSASPLVENTPELDRQNELELERQKTKVTPSSNVDESQNPAE